MYPYPDVGYAVLVLEQNAHLSQTWAISHSWCSFNSTIHTQTNSDLSMGQPSVPTHIRIFENGHLKSRCNGWTKDVPLKSCDEWKPSICIEKARCRMESEGQDKRHKNVWGSHFEQHFAWHTINTWTIVTVYCFIIFRFTSKIDRCLGSFSYYLGRLKQKKKWK